MSLVAVILSPAYEEMADFILTAGEHDQTYSYKRFTGGAWTSSASEGLGSTAFIDDAHDILFSHCIFDAPDIDGLGDYAGYKIGNALCVYSETTVRKVYNIAFEYCTFKASPRMGAEIIERYGAGGQGYRAVDFKHCLFEPCGSEPLSYDDDSGDSGDCEISDCILGGGGLVHAGWYPSYPWKQGFEINTVGGSGKGFLVARNTFYASLGDNWNLRGIGAGTDCAWTFEDNIVHGGTQYSDAGDFIGGSGIVQDGDSGSIYGQAIKGGVWTNNSLTNDNGWCISYLDTCADMDLSDTTWLGDNNAVHGENACSGIVY